MNLRYLNLFNVPWIFFTLLRDIFRLLNSIARPIMNIEKSNCILQVLIDEMNSKNGTWRQPWKQQMLIHT